MKKAAWSLALAGALAISGLAFAQGKPQVGSQGEVVITNHSADDPVMNAARAEARRRLPEFFAALTSPQAGDSDFMIKFDLSGGGADTEHIWASDVQMVGSQIIGRLANVPINPAYERGQQVTIRRDDITDWGFFRGRVMQGNFTTRVQLQQMPALQAAQIRQNFGW